MADAICHYELENGEWVLKYHNCPPGTQCVPPDGAAKAPEGQGVDVFCTKQESSGANKPAT